MILRLLIAISLILIGCTNNQIRHYLENHPDLSPDKSLAMHHGYIINGMTAEEVNLVLGEPTFREGDPATSNKARWVYRETSGIKEQDAYQSDSAFPQGVGYVIPLNYHCKELRVDFSNGKVWRIEKILRFNPNNS